MREFPIGIIVDWLKGYKLKDKIHKAALMGADGIQLYATDKADSPLFYSASERRDLLDYIKSQGLVVSAVCGDLGHGFGNKAMNPKLIDTSKKIIELTRELDCRVMTTHIGVVPSDPMHQRYEIMQNACGEIAEFSASYGVVTAIETGPEKSYVLKHFIENIGSAGIGVNFDPANLVMVMGEDPAEGVHNLGEYIVHTHAKDGIKLLDIPAEIIYRVTHPVPEEYKEAGPAFRETPLGKGNVNFPTYLEALRGIGYTGFLTIEREIKEDPQKDISEAIRFLENLF